MIPLPPARRRRRPSGPVVTTVVPLPRRDELHAAGCRASRATVVGSNCSSAVSQGGSSGPQHHDRRVGVDGFCAAPVDACAFGARHRVAAAMSIAPHQRARRPAGPHLRSQSRTSLLPFESTRPRQPGPTLEGQAHRPRVCIVLIARPARPQPLSFSPHPAGAAARHENRTARPAHRAEMTLPGNSSRSRDRFQAPAASFAAVTEATRGGPE